MWACRIQTNERKFIYGELAAKYKVRLAGYPISWFKRKGRLYVILAGMVYGDEKAKKAFNRAFRRNPHVLKAEISGDFAVALIREPVTSQALYRPEIISVTPALISSDGTGIWNLASWSRPALLRAISFAKKHYDGRVLRFGKAKLTNISVSTVLPELTEKQRKALELAVGSGYYDYPRRVEMKALAKLMGISYATFAAHLRKAERAIIPAVLRL